jgi:hypothetical protein
VRWWLVIGLAACGDNSNQLMSVLEQQPGCEVDDPASGHGPYVDGLLTFSNIGRTPVNVNDCTECFLGLYVTDTTGQGVPVEYGFGGYCLFDPVCDEVPLAPGDQWSLPLRLWDLRTQPSDGTYVLRVRGYGGYGSVSNAIRVVLPGCTPG